MAITVPKDGDIISAGVFGIPVANQVNTNTSSIATLRGLPVVRMATNASATTDANGKYTLPTPGFTAVCAIAVGTQQDYPAIWLTNTIVAGSITFSAHHPDGTKWPGAILGINYVVFGPAP